MSLERRESIKLVFLGIQMCCILISGIILSSAKVAAVNDSIIDTLNITVPVACTMKATGQNSHNANINNGTYVSDIGSTTLHALCNDNEGFAIYAAGYTGNEIGGTNSNKLVGTNASNNATIESGTATTAGNPDISNWAMKLAITQDSGDTIGTKAFTIDSDMNGSFGQYHVVPSDYVKVAHKDSITDMDETIGGVILTTTYAAYISKTQVADTYSGQVIYTLVHPASAATPVHPDQIGVTYHANGSTFAGGAIENHVVYDSRPMYIATESQILKSSNISDGGVQNGSYTGAENVMQSFVFPGASKVKVVLTYDITARYAEILMSEEEWDWETTQPTVNLYSNTDNLAGEDEVYVFDGDSVVIQMNSWNTPVSGHDYGVYARVYPIYATEQEGTEISDEYLTISLDKGNYAQTTDWYGSWYSKINGAHYDFVDESDLISFLEYNAYDLRGTTIDLTRGLSFEEAYGRANKVQNDGYYVQQDLDSTMCQMVAVTQNQRVKDIRDDTIYMIGKLKDGNCWMMENLALDPTIPATAANINSGNTNATMEAINNLLNGGNVAQNAGWSNMAIADVDSNFSSGGYTVPHINNASKDVLVTSYGPASTNGQAKVGIYYNYCAASAGTYCYEEGNGVDIPNTIKDVTQDLCPANWRLPTGGSSGESELLKLARKYKSDSTTGASSSGSDGLWYNLSATLSGYYAVNGAMYKNVDGNYWSSTANANGSLMQYLDVYDYGIIYLIANNRHSGQSIRCIAAE